jgi:hypothetical protein
MRPLSTRLHVYMSTPGMGWSWARLVACGRTQGVPVDLRRQNGFQGFSLHISVLSHGFSTRRPPVGTPGQRPLGDFNPCPTHSAVGVTPAGDSPP